METIPISRRALLQRVQRILAKKGQTLKVDRSMSRYFPKLKLYYVIDTVQHCLVDFNVNLLKLGKHLKALKKWERLQD